MKKFIFVLTLLLFFSSVSVLALYENGDGLYSDYAYMENLETGRVVYEYNSTQKAYPASLTKVMTCILAIEHCGNLNEEVEIPSGIFDDVYAEGGANISLKTGELISVYDLICATLIRSGCDSASALAWYVSGSVEEFANLMNEKAAELGADNTHFVNAHGLHDERHYTTAEDIATITKYALQNETFCDIISKWNHTIGETNMSGERYFESTMELEIPESAFYNPSITGVKSGFTDQAGRCLITLAKKDGESYLLVTLGANRDKSYSTNMAYTDAVNLHEYSFARFSITNILNKDEALASVKVKDSDASVELYSKDEILWLCAVDEDIETSFDIPDEIAAPVSVDAEIGTVKISVGEKEFTKPLFSSTEIKEEKVSAVLSDNAFVSVLNISTIVIYSVGALALISFCLLFFKKKR